MSTTIQSAIEELWRNYFSSTTPVPDQLPEVQKKLVARLHNQRHAIHLDIRKLAREAKSIEADLEKLVVLPSAPLEGVPGVIEPLLTPDELKTEGRIMRHSAGYKIQHVFADSFFYRLLPFEDITRATIVLKTDGDSWIVSEVVGVQNSEVTAQSKALVEQWVKDSVPSRTICDPAPFAKVEPVNLREFMYYLI